MGVNSLPKTVTRQRRGCDLNPGLSVPESSTLTTRLPSHPIGCVGKLARLVNLCRKSAPKSQRGVFVATKVIISPLMYAQGEVTSQSL